MKKLTLVLTLTTIIACSAFAQINFNKDIKWADALAQAKATHKLIFLDMYTDWCGPCKEMDKDVFPMPAVGDVFNSSFINYKLDAEKGEGPAVRKKYDVASYPNYLFVDGDGTLIYRTGGSMPAYEFVQNAKNALLEAKEPQTIVQMEALYPAHKTDKEFMFTYLSRLAKLRLPTIPMLDDYVTLLNSEERADPKNILLIINNGTFLNKKLPLGIALDVLKQNVAVYNELNAKGLVKNNESINSIEHNAMDVSLKIAIENKDDKLFAKVRNLKEDAKNDPFNNKLTLAMDYYYNTKNLAQYKSTTKAYANFLIHFPVDTLNKWDDRTYYTIKADIEKKNDPKYNTHDNIYSYRHTQTIQVTRNLSNASEQMMTLKLTKEELAQAKAWALKAVRIAETDMEFYQYSYPHYQRVYAIALYKSNQKHAAILQMQNIIATMPKIESASADVQFNGLLAKMTANQKL